LGKQTHQASWNDYDFTANKDAFPAKFYQYTVEGMEEEKRRRHLIFVA